MEFEPIDGLEGGQFDLELSQALARRPAPPGLKRKLMEQRARQNSERRHNHLVVWQRLAACLVLAGLLGGAFAWRGHQQQLKGEAARRQVLTALRITNHALNAVKIQLTERDRDRQE